MAIEMLNYSQLGERLSCSPEAARALVKRLRLPRRKANDGKMLVSVDLNEIIPTLVMIDPSSSLPGLTRQSIFLRKILTKKDGCAGQARA